MPEWCDLQNHRGYCHWCNDRTCLIDEPYINESLNLLLEHRHSSICDMTKGSPPRRRPFCHVTYRWVIRRVSRHRYKVNHGTCTNRGVYWNPKHSIGECIETPNIAWGTPLYSPILCLGYQYTPLFEQCSFAWKSQQKKNSAILTFSKKKICFHLFFLDMLFWRFHPLVLIERNPPLRGGFLLTMFPDQEPGGRGPRLKNHPKIDQFWGFFFKGGPLPPGSWSGNTPPGTCHIWVSHELCVTSYV